MVPSFIIFTAVSIYPRHLARRTTPNCPEPNSSSKTNSLGSISHLSVTVYRTRSVTKFKCIIWLHAHGHNENTSVVSHRDSVQRWLGQACRTAIFAIEKPAHRYCVCGSLLIPGWRRSNAFPTDSTRLYYSVLCDSACNDPSACWIIKQILLENLIF